MISIQNVSKWFGKFKAIDSVNIEVKKGEIFGLLGLNGAGKTTTQRMVSTVFQPTKGEILVNGFNSKNDSSEVRKNIGFLPTEVGLYDRLTAREVIRYFGILNDIEENQINDKIDVILEKLSLTEYADKRCSKLSRGNKQKVAVLDFVKQCKEDGRTILYSSHSMYETEEICDRISIIHDGKILMTNSIKKIQKEYESLENAFISIVKDEKSWE